MPPTSVKQVAVWLASPYPASGSPPVEFLNEIFKVAISRPTHSTHDSNVIKSPISFFPLIYAHLSKDNNKKEESIMQSTICHPVIILLFSHTSSIDIHYFLLL